MFESKLNRGVPNGYAPLNGSGKVAASFLETPNVLTNSGSTIYSTIPSTSGFTANNSFFLGSRAGANTFDSNSNFIGLDAGNNATGATSSNFIGHLAGSGATDANNSNFIGETAGQSATFATQSNFLGGAAGFQATGASYSNFFGNSAGLSAFNAQYSNFFGNSAGGDAIYASFSNFFGYQAGNLATNATGSNFLGNSAGSGATGAYQGNFLGNQAGGGAIGAFDSNFFGSYAGFGAANANSSTFIGNSAGYNAVNGSGSVFIGVNAGGSISGTPANFYYASNFIGPNAGNGADYAYNSNFFGDNAGYNATGASYSTFMGYQAGRLAMSANNSTFIGQNAGLNATYADNSVFIGWNAGSNATGSTGANFIGQDAGNGAANAEFSNFFGINAGFNADNASDSNFLGLSAGLSATSANDSNFFGNGAGFEASNANDSNFFGYHAGYNATGGSYSTLIGFQAGYNAFTGTGIGSNNIVIGTNLTLPDGTSNALNIGGVLFGTGTHSDSNTQSISAQTGGKIGIGVVSSAITNTLHISGTNPVRIQGLTANTGDTNILSVDATGVLHTFPVSSISGGGISQSYVQSQVQNKPNNQITIYNKSYWTGITSDWTVSGMTLTANTDNSFRMPAGTNDFTKFMTLKSATNNDENVDFEIIFKISATGATAFGTPIGRKSSNTFFSRSLSVNLDFSQTSGTGTFLKVNDGLGTTNIYTGNIAPLPAPNDTISLTLSLRGSILNVYYRNLTTGTSGVYAQSPPIISNLHPSDGTINWLIPNTGDFCIWNNNVGGVTDILSIKIVSFSNPVPKIMWIGDSKTQGVGSYYINSRMPNLCKSLGSMTVMAGGGDRIVDILADIPYITTNFKPKYVILNIGRNDVSAGISAATYQANYSSIVTSLKANGSTVIHLLPIPETGLTQTALTNYITATYSGDPIIDSTVGWVNTIDLSAIDGVHPNPAGYRLLANLVKNSGYIVNNNDQFEYPPFTNNVIDIATNSQWATSGADIYYNSTGNVGIGVIPTVALDVYSSTATRQIAVRSGLNTGAAFYESLNDLSNGLYMGIVGSTWATALNTPANYAFIWATTGVSGMTIQTNGTGAAAAPITFDVNGIEAMRISTSDHILIGTSTDDGVNTVQISAATNPIKIIGLSATSADTSVLSVDATGAVHKTTTSNLHPHGQIVLSAGTKTVVINGITSSSLGFPSVLSVSGATGATPTFQYIASASTNSLLIRAVTISGTTNTGDSSTVNYFVIV